MRMLLAISLSCSLFTASAPVIAESISSHELRYNALHALQNADNGLTEHERAASISTAYEKRFRQDIDSNAIRDIPDKDLDWVLKSAHLAAFYTHEQRYLEDSRQIMNELERRGITTDTHRALFFQFLVGYRRFDEIYTYLDRHPSLDVEKIPFVANRPPDENKTIHAYAVDQDERRIFPQSFLLSNDVRMVVVSHPLCAFSRHAMEAISGDPSISAAIGDSTIWLAPVDMRLYFDQVQAWNRDHVTTPVVIARHRHDWPMIDEWSTPNFYLLRDGEVIDRFSGWPLDGSHRERLVRMLSLGGLLPSTQ